MKLIKPEYLIMNQAPGMSGLLKHIELAIPLQESFKTLGYV